MIIFTQPNKKKAAIDPFLVVAILDRGKIDGCYRTGLRLAGHIEPIVVKGKFDEILAKIEFEKSRYGSIRENSKIS